MIVLDDKTCPVGFVQNLEKFFARESCGWCTPCREGLPFVEQTLAVDLDSLCMSEPVLQALLDLRAFMFERVYENEAATAEFAKATGILGGLWEKVRLDPDRWLDRGTIEREGLDAAARDFLAGMTDRYAVRLFEELFIPRPWIELPRT